MITGTKDAPYVIEDFSGGITDFYTEGPDNAGQIFENLELTPTRKIKSRPGITWLMDAQGGGTDTRFGALFNHADMFIAIQDRQMLVRTNDTTYQTVYGPNGPTDPAIPDGSAGEETIYSHAYWRGHTFVATDTMGSVQKMYKDSSDLWQVRNAGLPACPAFTHSVADVGTTKTYLYGFVLKYTYTVGAVTFTDRGPVLLRQVQKTNDIGGGSAVTLTPPGSLVTNENWDEGTIDIEIYRTVNNGKNFYLVTTIDVTQTAPVSDTMTDATLQLQSQLYTNSGELDRDQPPQCKYLHVLNDTGYFAYCKDTNGTYAFQLRQSIPGDVDSVPSQNVLELRESITGLSSFNDRIIVMSTNEVNRVEGKFDRFGRGSLTTVRISSNAGCASNNSIVQTPGGLFWFGNDGIYYSNGLTVDKISPHINQTFLNLVSSDVRKSRIHGTYQPELELVIWTVCRDNSTEADALLILDLRWGLRLQALNQKQTPATFYFWNSPDLSPTAVTWINQSLCLASDNGYLYQVSDNETVDIKYEDSGSPSDFLSQVIIYDWKSCSTDFGSKFMRKWVTWVFASCENSSNLSLQMIDSVDNARRSFAMKPIRFRGNIVWGESEVFWGEEGYGWNVSGMVEERRRVAAGMLRCNHRQLELTNAHIALLTSDTTSDVTVNASAKTAVLDGTLTFPTSFYDYFIAFENDGYEREFLIASISTNTLVYVDAGNLGPANGSYGFVIRGKPKNEVFSLNGVMWYWQPIDKSHKTYSGAGTGEPST